MFFPVIALLIGIPAVSCAQWARDGALVREMVNAQRPPSTVSDGAGGAIVGWKDFRHSGWDLFAQRIGPDGAALWEAGGVPVCMEGGSQHWMTLTEDGGGAVAVWLDMRRGWDIYAQRIDAGGNRLWRPSGNPICLVPGQKTCLVSAGDGAGGAIAVWVDLRNNKKELFTQRVNGEGKILWGRHGIAVCSASFLQWHPEVVPDGDGGIIITWQDRRNGNWDIYVQKVNMWGEIQWDEAGVPVSTEPVDEFFPVLASDHGGGAVVSWHKRHGEERDVFTQRIDRSGCLIWQGGGVPIGATDGDQMKPRIVTDAGGDAVIVWVDTRNRNRDIYAQRLDSTGALRWKENGVGVCTHEEDQWRPAIMPDGESGVIVAWQDMRNDYRDIYAQKIDANGVVQWPENGVAVTTAVEPQVWPRIVTDGGGGAIVVWIDMRKDDYSADIYAMRIDRNGVLGNDGQRTGE